MSDPAEYTLKEFEDWCEGKGRNGGDAGRHYQALQAIERFKLFKKNQAELVVKHFSEDEV